MVSRRQESAIAVLASGGLDSCILVCDLLREKRAVQPIYIRTGLRWQDRELQALKRFLRAVTSPELADLVVLDLPLADLYGNHWSVTGAQTPDATSPDEAVFLPGRNALLLVKAAIWCQLNGVPRLTLAPLGTSPFEDAQAPFFHEFQTAINRGSARGVQLVRAFSQKNKRQVMQLGRDLPLELTFSCIAPQGAMHCGRCNKCAERQAAFREAKIVDRTAYATLTKTLESASLKSEI